MQRGPFGPTWEPKGSKHAKVHRSSGQEEPRISKVSPKWRQGSPKGWPRAPRRPKEIAKEPQGSPKRSKSGPKALKRHPPKTPKSSQFRRLCSGFGEQKMPPKCTQVVPERAQGAAKTPQRTPKTPVLAWERETRSKSKTAQQFQSTASLKRDGNGRTSKQQ